MRAPEFVVVGAPKCGTTALCRYLGEHPRVYFSPVKEPNYFAVDVPGIRVVDNLEDYTRLFRLAGPTQIRGEGSTSYLFSKMAVPAILEYNPHTRLIIMVRNPLDMVPAYHNQKLYSFQEDQPDFSVAWRMSVDRSLGMSIPTTCLASAYLNYHAVGRLGEQVKRVLDWAPSDQVHVIVFDDFVANTSLVFAEILRFLELEPVERSEFHAFNARKTHRVPILARSIMHPPPALRQMKWALRRIFPEHIKTFGAVLHRLNQRPKTRLPVSSELRDEMVAMFEDDIRLLGALLGRDLTHWLSGLDSFRWTDRELGLEGAVACPSRGLSS